MVRTDSGGMQRRLDVAMGLIDRPEALFLDEPTAGLDPESRSAMWDEIARLSAGEGLTILLTTHYLEEADRLASQLAIVERGTVVAAGSPDELKARLHGDSVHVELAGPGDPAQLDEALRQVPEVRDVRASGTQLSARADDGATTLPALLMALERAGIGVHGITATRPTLDDVYLRYAGRRLAEAEEPARTPASPPRPHPEEPDDRPRHAHHLDDPAPAEGAGPPARLLDHPDDPARDLAVPVRFAVPQGGGAARIRRPVLPRLPGARGRRDERAVHQHVGRHDGAPGDRPRIMDRFLVLPLRRSAIINASVVMQSIGTVIQSLIIVGLGLAAGAATRAARPALSSC